MAHEIDWLNSRAGLCRVDLYKHDVPQDKDCEVVCFIDIASLNLKEKNLNKAKKAMSESSFVSSDSNDLDLALENLEEKDVIVIQDNERKNAINTVCLFKQRSSEEGNVVNWLSNDLHKYATGFQKALSNGDAPPKAKPPSHLSGMEKNVSFQGSDPKLLLMSDFGRSSLSSP